MFAEMKNVWGNPLTTIFPRQGHYALGPYNVATYPAADLTVVHIGDLVDCDLSILLDKVAAHRVEWVFIYESESIRRKTAGRRDAG
jgi:hypothetical protein